MKIAGTNPIRSSNVSRRQKTSDTSGASFASELKPSCAAGAVAPATQAGVIDGILALQEVDEDGRGGNSHVERGEEMLDRLDEIRSGLLSGNINPRALEQLLQQVRAKSENVSDPGLREIL
ncbi:MAG: flagellar assembly protein FliX [Alphaproteobacteria bacterium]